MPEKILLVSSGKRSSQEELSELQNPENLIREDPLDIQSGDTLSSILANEKIVKTQIHAALKALQTLFNPRDLRPSHEVFITTSPHEDGESRNLLTLLIHPSFNTEITLEQNEKGGYDAQKSHRKLQRHVKSVEGAIRSSLYVDALGLGLPSKAVHQMITAFSYAIDFQRNIHPGNRFRVLYEVLHDSKNKSADVGRVLLAEMEIDNKPITVYFFDIFEQWTGYYHKNGRSVQKSLLRTPIDGARISSGFGKRKHPILGFTKHHKGVDFAAPPGTPIYAAGSGVIEQAGRNGAYGNYLRIRHFGTALKTAYAHLSRFAQGMRAGKTVRQRQIIGYVGATGRATGPHLHYEVIKNGQQINPMHVKTSSNITLSGKVKAHFDTHTAHIDHLFEIARKSDVSTPIIIEKNLSLKKKKPVSTPES
ncbi:MAG: peptidoglycan DD-metalloendopeptidase family protein [Alphaproteobacteria bacterium]|nr:MAG: peptidoglycan DD-metalloendopeptidase family protein [Alphaproteobacteria bacterium]